MFWILCATVCFAIFLMATAAGTVMASLAAKLIDHPKVQIDTLHLPNLLFALRIFPMLMGVAITFGFVLPSFLLLEPKETFERPDRTLLLLALCSALVLALFVRRGVRLVSATRRIVGAWCRTAQLRYVQDVVVPVYVVERPESTIALAGFFSPKIFIGKQAFATLSDDEVRAAIEHEIAHARSRDNLKQFVLHVTRPPQCFRHLASIESRWSKASEFAADKGALEQGISALDLASTLVKIGTLKATARITPTLAVSHLVAPGCSSAVGARVQQLQTLLTDASPELATRWHMSGPGIGLLTASVYLATLPTTLPVVHRFIEWLVR